MESLFSFGVSSLLPPCLRCYSGMHCARGGGAQSSRHGPDRVGLSDHSWGRGQASLGQAFVWVSCVTLSEL